ncbi:MAG: dihydrofolate reductase family protein [Candidatus Uhrbacteria bacterium]|nr:dihydrofolate reductase family protein [Candidatus Uhrbacteria bacterium]
MPRPITTLFMLMSIDGKISTGDSDELDFDRDLPRIDSVKEGLYQYYDLEKQTDACSLNTGRVMAKIGVNDRDTEPTKILVDFVIVDNQPHLTSKGVEYLSKWVRTLYLVTTNKQHPAHTCGFENVEIIPFEESINFKGLLEMLGTEHGIERMTIQSGGTLNAKLIRDGLIDHLSIVVAPVVVGGASTPTLIDGESFHTFTDLKQLKALELVAATPLEHSYLHLQYNFKP